jgi:carbon starvation protein
MLSDTLASGKLPAGAKSVAAAHRMLFNDRLDAAVSGFFSLCVLVIIVASAIEWVGILRGTKEIRTTEVAFDPAGTELTGLTAV